MTKMTRTSAMRNKILSGVLTLGMLGALALTASAAAPPADHDRGGQRGQEGRGRVTVQDRSRNTVPDRGRNIVPDRGRNVVQQNRDFGGRVDQRRFDGDRGGDRDRGDHDRDFDRDRFVARTYVPSYVAPINVGAIAQQNGYRDGFGAGQYDAYHSYGGDWDDNPEFRNGLEGYIGTYGDSGFYQSNYRIGFQRGYNDGFNSAR
jgi:hypothetical protein